MYLTKSNKNNWFILKNRKILIISWKNLKLSFSSKTKNNSLIKVLIINNLMELIVRYLVIRSLIQFFPGNLLEKKMELAKKQNSIPKLQNKE